MAKEEHARAPLSARRSAQAQLPGLWQAAAVAALSALLAGYWARPGNSAPDAATPGNVSLMAGVAAEDETGALGTISGTDEQLAQLAKQDACSRRLAWVTVMRSPGQPPGRIRLQSGRYLSPAFDLTDSPVRVALPYPAPHPAGRGMISVLGTTTGARVALTPPWQVVPGGGVQSREVTWHPAGDCPGATP